MTDGVEGECLLIYILIFTVGYVIVSYSHKQPNHFCEHHCQS